MNQISQPPKIRKTSSVLIDDCFKHPKTILLTFHYEPYLFSSTEKRLSQSRVQSGHVAGKDFYIIDGFFSESEAKGEKPARAMNSQERWQFFSRPPEAVNELFKLFNLLAHQMDGDITTLPWDLCNQNSSSPCFATNFLEEMSAESMEYGKHRDYHPEEKISFGIPLLYSSENAHHPNRFVNGEVGRPWIISIILYSAAQTFHSEYGLGTVFYQEDGEEAFRVPCQNMRLLFFEGDIIHSIEESKLPSGIESWRVSYVFKLVFNPGKENLSMKKAFSKLIRS